jgi:hypothetical protein
MGARKTLYPNSFQDLFIEIPFPKKNINPHFARNSLSEFNNP